MAKKKANKKLKEEIELNEGENIELEGDAETATFADAKGSEANQHAKKLAQAKSKKAKEDPAHTFYTQKGHKVVKLVVKPGMTHSIYIGQNKDKKHKAVLGPMIEGWKKAGVWLHDHEVKEKTKEIQDSFKK